MSLPHERTYSIERTRNFLRDLLDPKKTPKVPKAIREKAYRCLRHFPWDLDIDRASKAAPDVFGPIRGKPLVGNLFINQDGPDLPFKEIDGEDFLESPEPNEALKKLMKGGGEDD